MTHSVASAAVRLSMDGTTCADARIILGSMAPTPLRCTKAEDMLKGKTPDGSLIAECADRAVEQSSPIDDQRASAWYRKRVAQVLTARALSRAADVNS